MATEPSTDWKTIPHTHPKAVVIEQKPVARVDVVHLTDASIRSSTVSGVFLVDGSPEIIMWRGRPRIRVQCLWFGRKPRTTWMHIACGTHPRFESDFSGEVVWNLGKNTN
jgi:hypothetical protein